MVFCSPLLKHFSILILLLLYLCPFYFCKLWNKFSFVEYGQLPQVPTLTWASMTMVTKNMNGSVINDDAFLIIERVAVTWGRESQCSFTHSTIIIHEWRWVSEFTSLQHHDFFFFFLSKLLGPKIVSVRQFEIPNLLNIKCSIKLSNISRNASSVK